MNKRKSVFSDFDAREDISFGEYLPQLDALLFADSRMEGGARRDEVVLLSRGDGTRKVVTAGGVGEGNPRISPEGDRILFLSGAPGQARQLFVYDIASELVRRIGFMRFGVTDPQWSPDGKQILFTSTGSDEMDENWLQTPVDPEEEAAYARKRAREPVVITDFGYKFDGLGFAQPEVMQLWVIPADGRSKARRITRGKANFMHASWAPDSRHVLCESNLYCDKAVGIAMDILMIDLESLEMRRVTEDKMVVSYPNPVRPVITPDGKWIIAGILDYREDGFNEGTYPACILHKISLDGKEMIPIFHQTEDCFDSVQFPYNAACGRGLEKVRVSSDGKWVLFHSGSRGESRIWRVPIEGEACDPIPVATGKFAHNGMGVPVGGRVLVARTAPDRPEAYFLMDEMTGDMELAYQSNAEWVENIAFSKPKDFFFETLDGESRVHGFCLPPQGAREGEKYPAIVYVHGGPHPFYTYGFDLEMQCFAGAGFGVLYCNPRGSSGYGDVHRNIARAFDGSAYTDILQFVSEACKRCDWIDEDRLGITGGSYGGYMTNYAATRTKKFKACVTQRAVVSELISYASSDMQGSSAGYPTFEEFMVHQIEKSVICGMEKVSAPFLILHGMDDLRCPVEGAHQLFVALKDSHPEDFPIKMVLYPHLSHDQPRHPKQRAHYHRTMVDWFKKYL